MVRSPALAAIATGALTALLASHGQIGSTTCQAFSVSGTSGVVRANANALSNANININMYSRMRMSLSETSSPTVELKKDNNGIYDLAGKDDHLAFLEKYPDKILIVKFFAPWCRACKGLEPKFVQLSKDKKYNGLPLIFAQLSVAHSKEYVKGLGILALPSIHIYAGREGLVENFPCGPSKVPVLKKKIAQVVNQKVDPKTYELKQVCETGDETEPCNERSIAGTGTGTETKLSVGDVVVSQETIDYLKTIPFFLDFTEEEFDTLMAKSTYSTFEAGSIIMKQGMPGDTFYVIDSGSIEMLVKGAFEDPLTTPSGYLGTSVNQLDKNNYFGERSLLTGQPRAASIRAVEKTRCFTFDKADIPESSSLSGMRDPTKERIQQVNDKYAVDYYNINLIDNQFTDANKLSQVRGSYNKPREIKGVDTDDDDTDDILASGGALEKDDGQMFTPSYSSNDAVLSLLVRFKLLRQAGKCFEYILETSPQWGDSGEVSRRSLLVSKLTPAQRSEFMDVFRMIDSDHDGTISMPEMKKALDAIGNDQRSDAEIQEMINKADPSVDGNSVITATEFMGVMAEAEFYYLFKETFATLDPQNSGYVQAGKLDKILCGLRDLISDDRKSIIDIDDKDMLIDYETFSRMMTGAIVPPGSSSKCANNIARPAPIYLKDGDYLGEYRNNAVVAPITPSDNFGLDDYEPKFFFDPLTWNTAKYSVALKIDDDDFTDDIFYFCHFMTGRMKFVNEDGDVLNEPEIPYVYDMASDYDKEECGTFNLDPFQLPHPECPSKFVCDKPPDVTTPIGKFANCLDSMNCAMTVGMTTNVHMYYSPIALFIHQMIPPHHQNAVNMCKKALMLVVTGEIECNGIGEDEEDAGCIMRRLCYEIISNGQNFQIQGMRGVLDALEYAAEDDCKVEISSSSDSKKARNVLRKV